MRKLLTLVLLTVLFAGFLFVLGVRAQSTGTTLEGTTTCTSVVYWFPDAFSRMARKNVAPTQPILTLFGNDTTAGDQTATVTAYSSSGPGTPRTVTVPVGRSVQVDLSAGDANFGLEVTFSGKGAADLKMWTNGAAVSSQGLPLCR